MAVAAVSTASSVDSAAVALTCGELGAVEGCCRELSSHCRTLESGDLPRTSVRNIYIYIDITMYIMYIYNYSHIYYMFFFIYGIRVLVRRQRRKKKEEEEEGLCVIY